MTTFANSGKFPFSCYRLQENYKHATTTSVSKRSVYGHYLDVCRQQSVLSPISHTYFGKLVRKAFPNVRCNRKGPRGSAQQHYRLIRKDGNSNDIFDHDEDDELDAYNSPPSAPVPAKTPRRNQRAAATAAGENISRIAGFDQGSSYSSEAWSFSSEPSSPVQLVSGRAGQKTVPTAEEDDDDDYHEEVYDVESAATQYHLTYQPNAGDAEEQDEVEEGAQDNDGEDGEEYEDQGEDCEQEGVEEEEPENGEIADETNLDLSQLELEFDLAPLESPSHSFSYGHSTISYPVQPEYYPNSQPMAAVPQQAATCAVQYQANYPQVQQFESVYSLDWNWTMPSAVGQTTAFLVDNDPFVAGQLSADPEFHEWMTSSSF